MALPKNSHLSDDCSSDSSSSLLSAWKSIEKTEMEFTRFLLDASTVDGSACKHAEETLKQLVEQSFAEFLVYLSGEVANDKKPEKYRRLAGMMLKNIFDVKDRRRIKEITKKWLSLDIAVRNQIKKCLLQSLALPVPDVCSTLSLVIGQIAGIELPHNQWPDLIASLLLNIHQVQPHVKQRTLETLGCVCKEVSPTVVGQDQVNEILNAVIQCMYVSEDMDVGLAAIDALCDCLKFAWANFMNDIERYKIMRAVCEATKSREQKIREAAFKCLIAIASTYYEKLTSHMQDILYITAKAVREDKEVVALEAIEFWCTVCKKEIDILSDDEIISDELPRKDILSDDSEIQCCNFIRDALHVLVPILLETLTEQEEDQNHDEGAWNISIAGGICLGLVARTVDDDIVPFVMPFIFANITQPNWRQREAAICAFGSILDGPCPDILAPFACGALSLILSTLTEDPNNHVKDTTAWTLRRIFEFLQDPFLEHPIVTEKNCRMILLNILHSMLDAPPNIAVKICDAVFFLAEGYEPGYSSSLLSPFLGDIIQALLVVTHREDAGESRLHAAAYEALNEVVSCSTSETAPVLMELVAVIIVELHKQLEYQKLSWEDGAKQHQLQGLMWSCLRVTIEKLEAAEPTNLVLEYSNLIMDLFLRLYASGNGTMHSEAMLAVGALSHASGRYFSEYMQRFYPCLAMSLQNYDEYETCVAAVSVIGDLCGTLQAEMLPFCDGIISQLLKDLLSGQLHPSVKRPMLSCFGAIAMAIGKNFEKHLNYVMPMLRCAAGLSNDSARTAAARNRVIEYDNQLMLGILDAYSGMIIGFKKCDNAEILLPYAPQILQFIDSLCKDKDRCDEAVMKDAMEVLGALADALGNKIGSLIRTCAPTMASLELWLDSPSFQMLADGVLSSIDRAISG